MRTISGSKILVAVGTVAFLATAVAFAAQKPSYLDAGAKMRGEFGRGFRPHTAKTYTWQARTNASVLYHYGQQYPQLPPATAQEHVREIRRNLDAARKEYAKIGSGLSQEMELKPHIDAIDKRLAAADKVCRMLEQHVTAGALNRQTMCAHCADLTKELKALEAEHDALMKKLGVEPVQIPADLPGAKESSRPAASSRPQ